MTSTKTTSLLTKGAARLIIHDDVSMMTRADLELLVYELEEKLISAHDLLVTIVEAEEARERRTYKQRPTLWPHIRPLAERWLEDNPK
jgi:hypothetical protein